MEQSEPVPDENTEVWLCFAIEMDKITKKVDHVFHDPVLAARFEFDLQKTVRYTSRVDSSLPTLFSAMHL